MGNRGRATLARARAAAFCCCVSLLPACSVGISVKFTAPSTAAAAATVLPVEDVRSISGVAEFHEVAELDVAAPAAIPNTPAGCRGLFDPPTVFGADWEQFRAAGYSALLDAPVLPIMADVRQAVAVYPDSTTAQTKFDRLTDAVPDCTKAGTGYHRRTVQSPDRNTLLLNSEEADGPYTTYRLTGTTLISTTALGLPDSERVAREVLDDLEQAQR